MDPLVTHGDDKKTHGDDGRAQGWRKTAARMRRCGLVEGKGGTVSPIKRVSEFFTRADIPGSPGKPGVFGNNRKAAFDVSASFTPALFGYPFDISRFSKELVLKACRCFLHIL